MPDLTMRLVRKRHKRWARELLLLIAGLEIHSETIVKPLVQFRHRAQGTIIQPNTYIGVGVTIFHDVTIGRQDVITRAAKQPPPPVNIQDYAVICAGAKVLAPEAEAGIVVGKGTVVAANAVLLQSTGEWEIWAGVPARLVGKRDPTDRVI